MPTTSAPVFFHHSPNLFEEFDMGRVGSGNGSGLWANPSFQNMQSVQTRAQYSFTAEDPHFLRTGTPLSEKDFKALEDAAVRNKDYDLLDKMDRQGIKKFQLSADGIGLHQKTIVDAGFDGIHTNGAFCFFTDKNVRDFHLVEATGEHATTIQAYKENLTAKYPDPAKEINNRLAQGTLPEGAAEARTEAHQIIDTMSANPTNEVSSQQAQHLKDTYDRLYLDQASGGGLPEINANRLFLHEIDNTLPRASFSQGSSIDVSNPYSDTYLNTNSAKPGSIGAAKDELRTVLSDAITQTSSNNLAKEASHTLKAAEHFTDAAEGAKDISKLAKAARLGGNIPVVGVGLGVAGAALTDHAHAAQRDFADDLHAKGILNDDALAAYKKMNTDFEIAFQADNAISTADPTGLSIISTIGVEAKANADFKDWAEKHAPTLTQEQYDTLSLSALSGDSARTEMLMETASNLPKSTEGQPEALHAVIEANNAYKMAKLEEAANTGEFADIDADRLAKESQQAQQKLVTEMESLISDPEKSDTFLNQMSIDDRMEYVRTLAKSEQAPEAFAKTHPDIAAYTQAYENSNIIERNLTGLSGEESLRNNPQIINDYIRERSRFSGTQTPEQSTQPVSALPSFTSGYANYIGNDHILAENADSIEMADRLTQGAQERISAAKASEIDYSRTPTDPSAKFSTGMLSS